MTKNMTRILEHIPFNRIILTYLLAVALAYFSSLFSVSQVGAASTANWDAGNIISDNVFTNANSMNAASIQAFLNSKVPSCDTSGSQTSEYGGGTRSQWAQARYGQSTFTCLKNYSENGRSAAQIIYDVSQQYQINPQVIIVLLQKEQGLVTDTWPLNIQYRSATGYGCPDTAACSSQYYGLTNQITWAARMFRAIVDVSPTWYTPYVLGNNYIQYNPTASCGGSTVFIRNRATQALYNYTPYQPNPAALAVSMGTTVNCGAYGNLNFYHYFNDWFGSSIGTPTYTWQSAGQQVSYKNTTIDSNSLTIAPGDTANLIIKARNTSNQTWYQYNTNIGVSRPYDRISQFYTSSWLTRDRTTRMNEVQVQPGGVATFTVPIQAPSEATSSREYFNVVIEGISWLSDIGYYYDITVANPTGEFYSAKIQSANLYKDAARTQNIIGDGNNVTKGSTLYGRIEIKNTGNSPLLSSTTLLATDSPQDRISNFRDAATWLTANRLARVNNTVNAGQVDIIDFTLKVPNQIGWYNEIYGIVVEGKAWINKDKADFAMNVIDPPRLSLTAGDRITRGNAIMSANYRYQLILQSDGNLVLYRNSTPLWSSNTVGIQDPTLILQSDGNLVLYANGGRAVWSTKTVGSETLLRLQDDGNLVIYSKNNIARWASNTFDR